MTAILIIGTMIILSALLYALVYYKVLPQVYGYKLPPAYYTDPWKKVVYIQYKDGVFIMKYKDYSFTEYHYNARTKDWRKLPSMKKVDNKTALMINEYFDKYPKLAMGKGGVNL